MESVIYKVSIPKALLNLELNLDQEKVQKEFKEWLIISLFQDGRISSGRAAKLLKVTKIEFLNILDKKGIAYFNYSPKEWNEEIEALQKLKPQD